MSKQEKYFVDERGGCIAVRDNTLVDPDYPGLHPDMEDVIKFWWGKRKENKCPTCGHCTASFLEVSEEDIKEANQFCETLNCSPDNL